MHGDAKPPDLFRTLADCQKARSTRVYDYYRSLCADVAVTIA
jgi:hypothetical protein